MNPEKIISEQAEKEVSIEKLTHHVDRGIEEALRSLRDRFENKGDKYENLPFHDSSHTEDVIRRTESILRAIQEVAPDLVSDHDIQIGKLAAAYHDVAQNWKKIEVEEEVGTQIRRERHREENELESRNEAFEFINRTNTEAREEIFTSKDKATIGEAHACTIPGFNPEENTVIQPNVYDSFGREVPLPALAAALGDLGTAGMDGKEGYTPEGDALFREENLDILDAIENPDSISEEKKAYFKSRMTRWSNFQPLFAEGRKNLLDKELSSIPEKARDAVRALFDKFDEAIEESRNRAEARKKMTFEELLADMGYSKK